MDDSGKKAEDEVGGTANVVPLAVEQMDGVRDIVEFAQRFSGYVPTSYRIMARKPNILRAFNGLIGAVMREPGEVSLEAKWLIAHAVSTAAGCRYCQAHTAANGAKVGLSADKIAALLNYEESDFYTPSERAIVALALAAGQVPNSSTREHFDALRVHFSDDAIVEIVAVISLFGWLNRWNDTLASDLEAAPHAFARAHLASAGWNAGKHDR